MLLEAADASELKVRRREVQWRSRELDRAEKAARKAAAPAKLNAATVKARLCDIVELGNANGQVTDWSTVPTYQRRAYLFGLRDFLCPKEEGSALRDPSGMMDFFDVFNSADRTHMLELVRDPAPSMLQCTASPYCSDLPRLHGAISCCWCTVVSIDIVDCNGEYLCAVHGEVQFRSQTLSRRRGDCRYARGWCTPSIPWCSRVVATAWDLRQKLGHLVIRCE